MKIWNRFMTSLRAGLSAWNDRAFLPLDDNWDSWQNRAVRYQLGLSLYNNKQYDQLANVMSQSMKQQKKLYRHTRGIFNPTYRTVEGWVSAVSGGELKQSLRGGAFHVETDDDDLREHIWQVLKWSNWAQNKSLYVRTGGMYGDVFLKAVDDTHRQKAYLEILDPRKVTEVALDETGNIKRIVIEYQRIDFDDPNETEYTYTEIIDKDTFATFKNGKPYGYAMDASGNELPAWDNPYGFVPVRLNNHMDIGQTFGAMAVHSQIDKINNINDQASIINDAIRNAVQVMYHAKGLTKGQLGTNSDEPNRDDVRLLYTNADAELIPLAPDIDIDGGVLNVEKQLDELSADIPILALHKIRDGANISQPGVIAGFSDAINQIKAIQSGYDHNAIKGIQMCLTIAGMRGYDSMPYSEMAYDSGDLEFTVRTREPIKSELTKLERVQTLNSLDPANPLTHLILEEMGYESDAIEEAERRAERARRDSMTIALAQASRTRLQDLNAQGRALRNGQGSQQQDESTVDDGATA